LLEKGFKGPELGEAIKLERLKALKAYKEAASV
jgi:tRNA nucleotidyltransferase (CCA-adding enzyme)